MNERLMSLQVFRGFAAVAVLLYHLTGRYYITEPGATIVQPVYNFPFLGGIFSKGHLGVDFFFVLSGFIIFWIHERDLGQAAAAPWETHPIPFTSSISWR